MNTKPTLQTLTLEGLLEIFKYVPLPECMFLRSTCRYLKDAVDEHFRSGVRTLPVLLSAHYSPESVVEYEKHFDLLPGTSDSDYKRYIGQYEMITLGSDFGPFQLNMWEKKEPFPNPEKHFRHENYLILFDLDKFNAFVEFITKYLPNITKLALFVDHVKHLENMHTIVNLYRKSLKVLLVDRTYRSKKMLPDVANTLPSEFYHSVNSLEALEKLYFFTKNHLAVLSDKINEHKEFINGMFRKLKIIHMSVDRCPTNQSEVFENLEELGTHSLQVFDQFDIHFPRLKKCFFLTDNINVFNCPENLEEIRFLSLNYYSKLRIGRSMMNILNRAPFLERIYCPSMTSDENLKFSQHPELLNHTVKYIEIGTLVSGSDSEKPIGGHISDTWGGLGFFQGVEKVVIREPFMELTGDDLTDKHFFPRVWNRAKKRKAGD